MDKEKSIRGLKQLKKVFDKHNINYWLGYGTALGIFRDNRIIPWDSDVDVGIWAKDILKLIRTHPDFIKTKFELYYVNGHYGIRDKNTKKHIICILPHVQKAHFCYWVEFIPPLTYLIFALEAPNHTKKEYYYLDSVTKKFKLPYIIRKILVDFSYFLSKKRRGKLITFVVLLQLFFRLYKINHKRVTPVECVLKTKIVKVYDEYFKIPSNTEKYLKMMFGKDWRTPKYYTKNEKGEKVWIR